VLFDRFKRDRMAKRQRESLRNGLELPETSGREDQELRQLVGLVGAKAPRPLFDAHEVTENERGHGNAVASGIA
jgi:hypothetical protein